MRSYSTGTIIRCASFALGLTLLAGCSSETLFQTNFNSTPLGQPPAATQPVGTVSIFGPAGSVVIVGGLDQTPTRWVRVSRASTPNNQAPIAGMHGMFSAMRGPGQYTFLCAMFMPKGSGLATIEFDAVGAPQLLGFMHIDFTTDNMVRIDDKDSTKFGMFPRDQSFDVIVNLDTAASPPTAHIALLGTGTSGSADYTIPAPLSLVQQFGAVTVWMGYPWIGSFDATDLLVTHKL